MTRIIAIIGVKYCSNIVKSVSDGSTTFNIEFVSNGTLENKINAGGYTIIKVDTLLKLQPRIENHAEDFFFFCKCFETYIVNLRRIK